MKDYSVLLLYPDYLSDCYGEETFYHWTRADTAEEAIKDAQKAAGVANESEYRDFKPLLVVEGHHFNQAPICLY